jgi:hypothetical protein
LNENKPYQNNQGLVEWSKWITGISLFSASGCVGVLVSKGVGEKNIINIKLAIVFFLVSIIFAWLIQLAVAMQDESFSYQDGRKPPSQILLKALIVVEIIMCLLSCFYLARWVWKFPAAKPAQEMVSLNKPKADSINFDSIKPGLVKNSLQKSEAGKRDAGRQQSARRNAARLVVPKRDSARPDSVKTDSVRYY